MAEGREIRVATRRDRDPAFTDHCGPYMSYRRAMSKTYRPGQFVWREIMTTDVAASVRFYGEAFGWTAQAIKMPDGNDYTYCKIGETGVAGMMKHPMPESSPPFWSGSVSVDDVDAVTARVAGAGGKVIVPPMDAGGMGRYAGFMDPSGAVVNAWRGNDGDMPAVQRRGAGEFCWEQLNTSGADAAPAFYATVFGWDVKPFGSGAANMQVFEAGGVQVASLMPTPPGVPSHWLSYIVVDKLADAHERVRAQGGKTMVERIEIATVGAIGVVQDNVGAVVGLFEMPPG
jgi:predicted enzyme related to lactoylglutathione lyase